MTRPSLLGVLPRLLLSMGSLVVLLGICEILLRFDLIRVPLPDIDSAWRLHWYRRRSIASEMHSRLPDRFHPVLGWVPKENISTVDSGGKRVSTNAFGARGTRPYTMQPEVGTARIVAIGDSFTWGECLNDEDSYPAVLEHGLDNTEVINFGVHGYGFDQMLLRLLRDGAAVHPGLVVLGFVNVDMGRILLSFRDYQKPRFQFGEGRLSLANIPLTPPEVFEKEPRLLAADLIDYSFRKPVADAFPGLAYRQEVALGNELIASMDRFSRAIGSNFALLYLPDDSEIIPGTSLPHAVYQTYCSVSGHVCIDPTQELHAYIGTVSDPHAEFACHYSSAVQREVGKVLIRAVKTGLLTIRQ